MTTICLACSLAENIFLKQLDIELMKLANPGIDGWKEGPTMVDGVKKLENLPLHRIREIDPDYEKYLRDENFKM